jgi:hypothetical protein
LVAENSRNFAIQTAGTLWPTRISPPSSGPSLISSAMSTQALESETAREGLKAVLLGQAKLYEALRE